MGAMGVCCGVGRGAGGSGGGGGGRGSGSLILGILGALHIVLLCDDVLHHSTLTSAIHDHTVVVLGAWVAEWIHGVEFLDKLGEDSLVPTKHVIDF